MRRRSRHYRVRDGETVVQMAVRIPRDVSMALRHYSIDAGVPMSTLVTQAIGEKLAEWGVALDGYTIAMDHKPPP